MNDLSVNNIAATGMDRERARVEMAMLHLSLVDVSFSSASEASLFLTGEQKKFSDQLFLNAPENKMPTKSIHDPSNPKANANGDAFYLNIDPTKEMATLVAATRAYEANVKAYNINAQMVRNALELGGK